MRRRGRKTRADRKDRMTGVLIVIVGLFLLSGLAGLVWWAHSRPTFDADTLCPSSGPQTVHALLFDRSDPITPQQAQQVRFAIDKFKEAAAASMGYRFDVYTFDG